MVERKANTHHINTTQDMVTLTEIDEIEPQVGSVTDNKFQKAADQFLDLVDLCGLKCDARNFRELIDFFNNEFKKIKKVYEKEKEIIEQMRNE